MDKGTWLAIILIASAIIMFFGNQYIANENTIADMRSKIEGKNLVNKYPVKTCVNDYCHILSSTSLSRINSVISDVINTTNTYIVLITVPSIEKASLSSFVQTLKQNLGFNDNIKKEGVLIIYIADKGNVIITGGYKYNNLYLKKIKADQLATKINNDFLVYEEYEKGFEKLIFNMALTIQKRNDIPINSSYTYALVNNQQNYMKSNRQVRSNYTKEESTPGEGLASFLTQNFSRDSSDPGGIIGMISTVNQNKVDEYSSLISSLQNGENPDLSNLISGLRSGDLHNNIIPFILGLFGTISLALRRVNQGLDTGNMSPDFGNGMGLRF